MRTKLVKIVSFISLTIILLIGLNTILRIKIDESDTWKMYYEQPKETIDVLAIGSSHVFSSINPAILYDEYGIVSYDLCTGGCNSITAYNYLKEGLKTQTPKVVIMELGCGVLQREVLPEISYMWTNGMKDINDKLDLLSVIAPENKWDVFLEFPVSHSRIDELEKRDFLPYRGDPYHKYYKGNRIFWGNKTEEYRVEDFPYVEEGEEIPDPIVIDTLNKVIQLSKENNFELILYNSPWLTDTSVWKQIHYMERMAAEQNIQFLNLADPYYVKQLNIDYNTEMSDKEHVNYVGNIKVSQFLGKYLKENYQLEDHRGDEKYESWRLNAEDYKLGYQGFMLSKEENLEKYINAAVNDDYITIISFQGQNYKKCITDKEKEALFQCGVTEEVFENAGAYINTNGKIENDVEERQIELGAHSIRLFMRKTSKPDEEARFERSLWYDTNLYPFTNDGITVLTFDTKEQSIVEWREYNSNEQTGKMELYRSDASLQEVWGKR